MSRRRNLLILVGILAILTAFLMAAYWPSTLPQVLGKDFAQLKEVQIHLSHVRDNSPSRDLTLSPDDPATGDLLALLEGQRYRPVYHNPWGRHQRPSSCVGLCHLWCVRLSGGGRRRKRSLLL